MSDPYQDWLARWFRAQGKDVTGCEQQNMFEAALIDSLGVIELIESAEAEFGFRFSEQSFQDRRFQTLAGLAQIMSELAGRG